MRFRENAENLHKPRRSSLVGVLLLLAEGEDRFSAWSPLTAHQNAAPGELACGRGMDNAAVSGSKAGGARTDTMDVNSIALIVLLGLWLNSKTYFESALLIAMLGFISTVAVCKYILRGDIIE